MIEFGGHTAENLEVSNVTLEPMRRKQCLNPPKKPENKTKNNTHLMCKHPETSQEEAVDESIECPQDSPDIGRRYVLGSCKMVE